MPNISEFINNFGLKDLILTLLIVAVIVIVRERERISWRKKDGPTQE